MATLQIIWQEFCRSIRTLNLKISKLRLIEKWNIDGYKDMSRKEVKVYLVNNRKSTWRPKNSIPSKVVGKPEYDTKFQVSRQMPRVGLKSVWRCCLSWTCLTLECISPAKRFLPKTPSINSTSTPKTRTNKYTRRLRYTGRTLLKLKNTKKLTYKISKNKHKTNKDKSN